MKILVISDSHGDVYAVNEALKRCAHHIDMCVFLGDGTRDADYVFSLYPKLPRVIVHGNCDMFFDDSSQFPAEAQFEADGVKFLAVHGHLHSVKSGLGKAAEYAAKNGADVLLYGHTHEQDDRSIETGRGAVRVINPGSIGRGKVRSFALVETVGGKVVCGFAEV